MVTEVGDRVEGDGGRGVLVVGGPVLTSDTSWWDQEAPRRELLLVALLVVIFVSALVTRVETPIVGPDELAYLGMGRWMAGLGDHPGLPFDPGISLVYGVLFRLSSDVLLVHHVALLLNAVMLGCAVGLMAPALEGRNQPLRRRSLLAAAILVAPMGAWYAHAAMAATTLLLVASVVFWALRRGRGAAQTIAWVLAGLAMLVHTRAMAFGFGLVVVCRVRQSRGDEKPWAPMIGYSAGVGISLVTYLAVVSPYLEDGQPGLQGVRELGFASRVVGDALTILGRIGTQAVGQVAVSGALVALGAWHVHRKRADRDPGYAFALAVALVAVVLSGVRAASDDPTARWLYYARYADPFVYPLVAVGAWRALSGARRADRASRLVLGAAVVSATVLVATLIGMDSGTAMGGFDTPTLRIFSELAGPSRAALVWLAAWGIFAGSLVVAALRHRATRHLAMAGLIGVMALVSAIGSEIVLVPWSHRHQKEVALVSAVVTEQQAACVSVDPTDLYPSVVTNLRLLVDAEIELQRDETMATSCTVDVRGRAAGTPPGTQARTAGDVEVRVRSG